MTLFRLFFLLLLVNNIQAIAKTAICQLDQNSCNIILHKLAVLLPNMKISAINKTPIDNILEVENEGKIFYIDSMVNYLLLGNLIDANTKENITASHLTKLNMVSWNSIPLKLAIRIINGKNKNELAIFLDPHCPYCMYFAEYILPKLKNITADIFILAFNDGGVKNKDAQNIICSLNKQEAFTNWVKSNKSSNIVVNCNGEELLTQIKNFATLNNITETPTIILNDGTRIEGVPPSADYLNNLIEQHESK